MFAVYINVYILPCFDFLIDSVYILFLEFEMALSEAWLKANNGKDVLLWAVDTVAKYNECDARHAALVKTLN